MRIQVGITQKGKSTESFLKGLARAKQPAALRVIGAQGIEALAAATPRDSGDTAESWSYKVIRTDKGYDVAWYNTAHPHTSEPVALLLQYGHGLRQGGYVPGVYYINPALRPVFDAAADRIFKELVE